MATLKEHLRVKEAHKLQGTLGVTHEERERSGDVAGIQVVGQMCH